MSRYVITNDETKVFKKLLKKYPGRNFSSDRLQGSFKVVGYRKYQFRNEVDIEFDGKLLATYKRYLEPTSKEWFTSDILDRQGVSKIKVNKLIKRHIFHEVKNYLNIFGISINFVEELKKITWV